MRIIVTSGWGAKRTLASVLNEAVSSIYAMLVTVGIRNYPSSSKASILKNLRVLQGLLFMQDKSRKSLNLGNFGVL